MLIFFVFVKLLSLMTINRVGQPDSAGWETRRSRHARHGQPAAKRVRDFYTEYAGDGGVNLKTGCCIRTTTRFSS